MTRARLATAISVTAMTVRVPGDAPEEWRAADERKLRQWRGQLEKLGFPLAA